MTKQTIVSFTAHPDDEVLGFGATAAKLSHRGFSVHNCILSGDVEARNSRPELEELYNNTQNAQRIMGCEAPILGSFPNIKFNTVPHIELVQFIERVIEDLAPDYIFTHHPNDLNNDHYHVSKACQAASRLFQRKLLKKVKALYFMEILSSTDWSFPASGNSFQPNTFFEIGKDFLEIKIKALSAYKGVMRSFPHPRSVEILTGLAALRGGQSGNNYAESFQCVYQDLNL